MKQISHQGNGFKPTHPSSCSFCELETLVAAQSHWPHCAISGMHPVTMNLVTCYSSGPLVLAKVYSSSSRSQQLSAMWYLLFQSQKETLFSNWLQWSLIIRARGSQPISCPICLLNSALGSVNTQDEGICSKVTH